MAKFIVKITYNYTIKKSEIEGNKLVKKDEVCTGLWNRTITAKTSEIAKKEALKLFNKQHSSKPIAITCAESSQ
jgi:hypothetical protein